jgi:hypothetical protein
VIFPVHGIAVRYGIGVRHWFILACVIAPSSRALADEADPGLSSFSKAAFVVELLVPDLRVERSFTFDVTRLTVAVPIVVHTGHFAASDSFAVGFNTIAEIQYVTGDEAGWRGSFGERLMFHSGKERDSWMPVAELDAVLGSDGAGGALGLGYGYGSWTDGSMLVGIARAILTDRERRFDFALDLQIPINAL